MYNDVTGKNDTAIITIAGVLSLIDGSLSIVDFGYSYNNNFDYL